MLTAITPLTFIERNWQWLLIATPFALYAAWIGSIVVPEVLRVVVPEVIRTAVGR
jgi:hypothetical protein